MFTGIVESLGRVVDVGQRPPARRLLIEAGLVAEGTDLGDSVAVGGCCLTVVSTDGSILGFDVGPETLSRTNLGELTTGGTINLERALRLGERLDGHFVTGHIDAMGTLERRQDDRDWSTFWIQMPAGLSRQMASKGSITVDGVSLTLIDVETERFSVQLIPHTLIITTLGQLKPGDHVNLETDLLAKYVEASLKRNDQ